MPRKANLIVLIILNSVGFVAVGTIALVKFWPEPGGIDSYLETDSSDAIEFNAVKVAHEVIKVGVNLRIASKQTLLYDRSASEWEIDWRFAPRREVKIHREDDGSTYTVETIAIDKNGARIGIVVQMKYHGGDATLSSNWERVGHLLMRLSGEGWQETTMDELARQLE